MDAVHIYIALRREGQMVEMISIVFMATGAKLGCRQMNRMNVRIYEEQKRKYECASERRCKGLSVVANTYEWDMSKQNIGCSRNMM